MEVTLHQEIKFGDIVFSFISRVEYPDIPKLYQWTVLATFMDNQMTFNVPGTDINVDYIQFKIMEKEMFIVYKMKPKLLNISEFNLYGINFKVNQKTYNSYYNCNCCNSTGELTYRPITTNNNDRGRYYKHKCPYCNGHGKIPMVQINALTHQHIVSLSMSPTDIFEVYLEYYKKYENNLMSDEYDVESFTINDIVHSRATQTNYKIIDVINTDNNFYFLLRPLSLSNNELIMVDSNEIVKMYI